jgi:peptide/nickel transport system substrate-binding protein
MSIPLAIVAQSVLDGNLGGDVMYMALVAGAWEEGRLVFHTAEDNPLAMARSYEYFGPDSTSLRFRMRSDLLWSDGAPITAGDIAYTYGILDAPALASPVQHYKEFIDSVTVVNDSTVDFHFSRRYPEMLSHTALQPLPAHIFQGTAPGELRNHPTIRNPEDGQLVVSGPYMIGSWQRGQSVTLVRNPNFRPAGLLDQVVFRVIPDPTTRLVELQTGRIDLLTGITHDQVPALRTGAPNVRLEREEKRFYDYIGYNPRGFEPFADREVRRALGLAIDVPGLLAALQMEEFAVPAGGPYAPIFRDLFDPVGQAPLPWDPAEARRILESKGWGDSNSDGILDRNGEPFAFTLVTNAGNQRRADVSQIIQRQWREVGIDVRLQQLETNTLSDNLNRRDFQSALFGWSVGLTPDLYPLWGAGTPFNFTSYENPEVTALIEMARTQRTEEAAADYWRSAASAIVADQPYTWLFYLDQIDGVSNRLQGTRIDTYGPYQRLWEWWVTDAPAAEQGAEVASGAGAAQ